MVTDVIIYRINSFVNRIFKKTNLNISVNTRKHLWPFFAAFPGERVSGKQGECSALRYVMSKTFCGFFVYVEYIRIETSYPSLLFNRDGGFHAGSMRRSV